MQKKENKKIELLSPAGSLKCAKLAIKAGADAIYMGGAKFGARAFAKSVNENSICEAIKMVHDAGKKFYLTVNTLLKQKELKELFFYIDSIVDVGVDAFIIQDLGVGKLLNERYNVNDNKNIELHASTQMTITSSKSINLLKKLGYTQVVLARELSLKEIKNIKKEVGEDIKIETFIHGSMCYSYSGTCLMSSFIGGESGNRGRCKGPCRLQYYANNSNLSKDNKYLLSMKDMCALRYIKSLIDIGVSSLKIEGRMRQSEYVEGVTKMYRKYIDAILSNEFLVNEGLKNKTYEGFKIKNIQITELVENFDTLLENIEKDEKKLLDLYNKGGFTSYYDKHNSIDMIQRYER